MLSWNIRSFDGVQTHDWQIKSQGFYLPYPLIMLLMNKTESMSQTYCIKVYSKSYMRAI